MSSALVDYPPKAREALQDRAIVRVCMTRCDRDSTPGTDMISGWSMPVVLVTSLLSKGSSAFTRITTLTLFSEPHPRPETRFLR